MVGKIASFLSSSLMELSVFDLVILILFTLAIVITIVFSLFAIATKVRKLNNDITDQSNTAISNDKIILNQLDTIIDRLSDPLVRQGQVEDNSSIKANADLAQKNSFQTSGETHSRFNSYIPNSNLPATLPGIPFINNESSLNIKDNEDKINSAEAISNVKRAQVTNITNVESPEILDIHELNEQDYEQENTEYNKDKNPLSGLSLPPLSLNLLDKNIEESAQNYKSPVEIPLDQLSPNKDQELIIESTPKADISTSNVKIVPKLEVNKNGNPSAVDKAENLQTLASTDATLQKILNLYNSSNVEKQAILTENRPSEINFNGKNKAVSEDNFKTKYESENFPPLKTTQTKGDFKLVTTVGDFEDTSKPWLDATNYTNSASPSVVSHDSQPAQPPSLVAEDAQGLTSNNMKTKDMNIQTPYNDLVNQNSRSTAPSAIASLGNTYNQNFALANSLNNPDSNLKKLAVTPFNASKNQSNFNRPLNSASAFNFNNPTTEGTNAQAMTFNQFNETLGGASLTNNRPIGTNGQNQGVQNKGQNFRGSTNTNFNINAMRNAGGRAFNYTNNPLNPPTLNSNVNNNGNPNTHNEVKFGETRTQYQSQSLNKNSANQGYVKSAPSILNNSLNAANNPHLYSNSSSFGSSNSPGINFNALNSNAGNVNIDQGEKTNRFGNRALSNQNLATNNPNFNNTRLNNTRINRTNGINIAQFNGPNNQEESSANNMQQGYLNSQNYQNTQSPTLNEGNQNFNNKRLTNIRGRVNRINEASNLNVKQASLQEATGTLGRLTRDNSAKASINRGFNLRERNNSNTNGITRASNDRNANINITSDIFNRIGANAPTRVSAPTTLGVGLNTSSGSSRSRLLPRTSAGYLRSSEGSINNLRSSRNVENRESPSTNYNNTPLRKGFSSNQISNREGARRGSLNITLTSLRSSEARGSNPRSSVSTMTNRRTRDLGSNTRTSNQTAASKSSTRAATVSSSLR
ncbi:hypothetical protein ABSA28_00618 [Candidatus Hepatincolaceae symbiont of Richtersius coronifer]